MKLAVIPGDGIGPDVVAEGLKVLSEVVPDVETTSYDLGASRWHRTGEMLPDSVLAELRQHDAILLGAVGDPSVPSGILERGLLLRLRFELDHHVNLRPIKLFAGVLSALAGSPQIDMVVVREGTEGPYAGNGGILRRDSDQEVATEVSLNTAFGVRRVVRDAFTRATARPRHHLTLVHKTNVLTNAGSLWSRTVEEISQEFPQVGVAYQHVDAAAMFFVSDPGRFDVVVTDNMFGDILTDLGAAITGGIGLAASGNLDVSRTNPSMFEPVHGSAPDLVGQRRADPTATVLSVSMMLDHLGHQDQARRVEAAVAFDLATRNPARPSQTTEVGDRLAALASQHAVTPPMDGRAQSTTF
ncbi:MAG: 3-isopropylmalate dehydrogenase [Geodermatophilaceae bacterium]|nr:3-isopropylmalate dehydrogenase [Geodermatophilaceae bacterium]